MKKQIFLIAILLLGLFLLNPKEIHAAKTYGDLLDDLESLKEEKREKENQAALSEAEYNRISGEIRTSQEKVSEYNRQIVVASNKISELEEEIAEKKDETNRILVFLELSSGEKSYLEYIFKATSFTDFIHRVSIVEQISKYNKELINEMNNLIKQNEDLKKELADNISKEEAERKILEANLRKVSERISDLYSEGATIEESIEAQEEVIKYYEEHGCTKRSDVLAICSAVPPATGFLRPVTDGYVTSPYGYRINPVYGYAEGHTGIDISASGWPVGKSIYPVAAGKVAFEVNWDCGGRVVGIHHVVNGVQYTSMYMHLQSFNVSVGDIVTTDTVIGYMGGIYDRCSTGPHVHLSMTYGHLTNPGYYKSYIFDPTELIYFPGEWAFFYSRSW